MLFFDNGLALKKQVRLTSQGDTMKEKTRFLEVDPGESGYQYLEDLSTAHWCSEVSFTVLD